MSSSVTVTLCDLQWVDSVPGVTRARVGAGTVGTYLLTRWVSALTLIDIWGVGERERWRRKLLKIQYEIPFRLLSSILF